MSQFTDIADVFEAAAIAMRKCKEAGVKFGFRAYNQLTEHCERSLPEFAPHAISLPIGIVEGRKVFIGDELWHPDYGKVKVTGGDWRYLGIFSESGTDCTRSCNEFSWQESKKTINVNGKEVPKPSQIEPAYKCTMVGHATDEDAQAFRDALEGK